MRRLRNILLIGAMLAAGSACATGPRESDASKLARYQSFAGESVSSIRYPSSGARGFDVVDDDHVVVETGPSEAYLFKLSGPCLSFDRGSPSLAISSQMGRISAGFDRVSSLRQPGMTCLVKEIRPLDIKALRAAEKTANGSS